MPEQVTCPTCGRVLPKRVHRPKITLEVRARVKHLRTTKGLKERVIAKSVGISQASVSRILTEHLYG